MCQLIGSTLLDIAQKIPPTMQIGAYTILCGTNIFFDHMQLAAKHGSNEAKQALRERRWSLFYMGPQWDRYLAAKGLTKVPNLIKYRA